MDVHSAMRTRRTIHRYRPEPVPEAALQRALDAALMAPNHKLTFPWRFTRVGLETRATLADLAVELRAAESEGGLPAEKIERIRSKILDPGELVVVSIRRCEDPITAREDYASAACAIQNLSLSLQADGLGSKWSSGKVTRHPRSYRVLGIDEKDEEIIGFIWVGHPMKIPECPQRPPLPDLLRTLP